MTTKALATVDATAALATTDTSATTETTEATRIVYTAEAVPTTAIEAAPNAPTTEHPSFNAPDTTQFETPLATPAPALAPAPEQYRGLAITSFVLGIVSLVLGWSFVAPIIGLVLGLVALSNNTSERKLALWGTWLNGVLLAIAAVGFFFSAAFAGAALLSLPFYPW